MVPHTFVTVTLRALAAHDLAAARLLADATLRVVPHSEPFRAALDGALRLAGDEHRGIVALDASGLIGLIVFGETAGARGAGRIAFVAVDPRARRRAVAIALIEAACRDLRERAARFVTIEVADHPTLDAGRRTALRAGFRREAYVADYVSDGVGLELLRLDLGPLT